MDGSDEEANRFIYREGWISGSNNSQASSGQKRPLSNFKYDEAVLKVQEWNEALKCIFFLRLQ